MAATNPSFRSVSGGGRRIAPPRTEHGGQQVVGGGVLVGQRDPDGQLDVVLDLAQDGVHACVVELAELSEQPLEPGQRVSRLPLLDERGVADVREVGPHRVLHPAERLHLEERGPGSLARPLQRSRHRGLDREHVVPVDDLAGHAVAGRAIGEILDRTLGAPVGRERELVVLADEDDGQRPRRGEVHALVGCALPGGAVAEERHRRLVGPAQPCAQGRAAGVGETGADDAVAAEDVQRQVGDVHRAAEPLAVARPLPEHLGHHPAEIGSGRDQMAVRAVVADEEIRGTHDAGGADRDRLLADAAVRSADDHALLEELGGAILEAADQRHQPVLLHQRRPAGGPFRDVGRLDAHRGGR